MDAVFRGFCAECPAKDYCFDHGVCLRRTLSNEYDDDDNVSDVSDLTEIEDLTEDATYSYHEGKPETDN